MKAEEIPEWSVMNEHHLQRKFTFPDFKSALAFVNEVGRVAEDLNHHPNIDFTWGKATITTFTHDVDGLTEKDYLLAKRISELHSAA